MLKVTSLQRSPLGTVFSFCNGVTLLTSFSLPYRLIVRRCQIAPAVRMRIVGALNR
jgi:hypothetical protein